MYYDLIKVDYLGDYKFHVRFEDGLEDEVDLSPFSKHGGVFRKFQDINYFKLAFIDSGVLTWPDGVDIAPETLYHWAGGPLPEGLEADPEIDNLLKPRND